VAERSRTLPSLGAGLAMLGGLISTTAGVIAHTTTILSDPCR
jgi:hypothetical protein